MKKEVEVIDKRIVQRPENFEVLMSKKRELERALEQEYGSVQAETDNISRIIQAKEAELLRFPERRTAINRMAFLLGRIGMQQDAEAYDNLVEELESGVPAVEIELENLTVLYGELARRAKRKSDREFRRSLDGELEHVRALWKLASRGEL